MNAAPHGFGRKIFSNAQYYIGKFENGEVHGFGTLYDAFDRILEQGTWFKGQIQSTSSALVAPTRSPTRNYHGISARKEPSLI